MPAATAKPAFGFDTVPRYLRGLFGNSRADMEASGGNSFNGKGGANAASPQLAARAVTVDRVLANGNLRRGEKRSRLIRERNFHPLLRRGPIRAPSAAATPFPRHRWRMRG